MRHPLFLTNLVLLILITSCSEDLYEDATENNRVKTVNIEDVPFLKENINQRRASFKSTSKNAVDYFSLIETQGILLVEKADGSKDYTFALKLPYQDTLTNLIAQEKNNVFTYSLLKYNAENQAAWLQGLEGPNPFAIPVNVTQTDLEGKSLAPSDYCPRLISICPSGLHTLSSYHLCNYYFNEWTFNVVSEPCPIEGGGGDTTPNNGGGSTIGGGSNTSTSPKPCKTCNFNNIDNDPCSLIKKLNNDFVFKTKLASLFQSAKIDNFEKYSVLSADPTPNTQPGQEDAYDYADSQGVPNATGAIYTAYTNSLGVIHSHYVGLNSIFSPDDLQDLYNKMLVPEITDNFFIGVVTAEGTAYILQIQDRQAFINFGNQYLANDDKTLKFTNKFYKGKYNLASNDKVANEKNFLKMMSDFGMGVSLAGTSFSSNVQPSPNLFSNLQVKNLNDLTQNVENTNCN